MIDKEESKDKCKWKRIREIGGFFHSNEINIECLPETKAHIQHGTQIDLKFCYNCGKPIEEVIDD
jgi:hypothetical protein